MTPVRPFTSWIPASLTPKWDLDTWQEPLESDLIWGEIQSYADVRQAGEGLFTGSKSEVRIRWGALNDYARQARAYFTALESTQGTARGLLGYYSALNLAKAELLHSAPEKVINKRIGHGLSFDVSRESTIRGDYIKVVNGVFPLLYEARTGLRLPIGTKLPVRQLLSRVPEVGREYDLAFRESAAVDVGWYRTVGDDSGRYWPVVLTFPLEEQFRKCYEFKSIAKFFDFCERPSWWRKYFPDVGIRINPQTYLQGRKTVLSTDPKVIPHGACVSQVRQAFGHSLESPIEGLSDFLISPSIYKTRNLPVTTFLARYALMFYVSSLVRYRPSRLNPAREQLTVWLLESFARQSPLFLLANGLEGVMQKSVLFNA